MTATVTSQRPSVAFAFAFETWADAQSRNMSWSADRMVQRLLVDQSVPSVLVSDPWRSYGGLVRRRRRSTRASGFPQDAGRLLVHPLRLRRRDPRTQASAAASYRRLDRWLVQRSRRIGNGPTVLVTCHPVHAAVSDRGFWSDVVYYAWDDWLNYPPFESVRGVLSWSYEQIAARDVKVIGVSDAIVNRVGARRSTVVPNAVSAEDFNALPLPPEWFRAIHGAVALYAGSLERRVDVAGLALAARQLPDWTFVLVGYLSEPRWFERLASLPNVVLRGLEPRSSVLSMMAHAQVCLVPHLRTPMSEGMSPLKLYEYLAAGAAVVATDLPPMRGLSERCLLVPPGEAYRPAILRAADLGRADEAELARWRKANDWDVRYVSWRSASLDGDPASA